MTVHCRNQYATTMFRLSRYLRRRRPQQRWRAAVQVQQDRRRRKWWIPRMPILVLVRATLDTAYARCRLVESTLPDGWFDVRCTSRTMHAVISFRARQLPPSAPHHKIRDVTIYLRTSVTPLYSVSRGSESTIACNWP